MSSPSRVVLLTPEAQDDFEAIRLYTRQEWGEQQEAIYQAAILQALATLGENPALGRPRRDLVADLRVYPVRQHLVYYRVAEEAVLVVRILHGRMDARRALGEPS